MGKLPTEPGFYWWRLKEEHRWQPVDVVSHYDTLKFIRPYRFDYSNVGDIGQFGPRLPSPDDLAAMARDAERFRKLERLATQITGAIGAKFWKVQPVRGEGPFDDAVDSLNEQNGQSHDSTMLDND